MNTGTPVSDDYANPFRFNGKIEKVTIDLKDNNAKAADKEAIARQQSDFGLEASSIQLEQHQALTASAPRVRPTSGATAHPAP